jgi:hypothetical protein
VKLRSEKSLNCSILRDSRVSKEAAKSIVSVLSVVRVQKSPQLKASNASNRKKEAAAVAVLPDLVLVVGHFWQFVTISGNFWNKSGNVARESLLFFLSKNGDDDDDEAFDIDNGKTTECD